MRAIFIREFGGVERIQEGELPEPRPGRGEVLVRVHAVALNHLDIWVRKGRPGVVLEGPHILGSDAAGVVEALGEGVAGFQPGDEVVVNAGVCCGGCEYCRRGEQSECPAFRLLGFQLPGVFAERIVVPAANLGPKPAYLSWNEAAALTLAHLTAWHMLVVRARFVAGDSVLIHGIGGGVALAALQLVRALGGEAFVTSSSDQKLERALSVGASGGINYRAHPDVGAQVKVWTAGRGVDIAFDTVGAPTLPASLAALRRGGRMVTCGVTGGREGALNLQLLYWNHISLLGSTMGTPEDHRRLLRLAGSVRFRPVVDKVYPVSACREATARMEAGEQFGKIVLTFRE